MIKKNIWYWMNSKIRGYNKQNNFFKLEKRYFFSSSSIKISFAWLMLNNCLNKTKAICSLCDLYQTTLPHVPTVIISQHLPLKSRWLQRCRLVLQRIDLKSKSTWFLPCLLHLCYIDTFACFYISQEVLLCCYLLSLICVFSLSSRFFLVCYQVTLSNS